MKMVSAWLFVLIAAQASAQSLQDCYNNIGIFNDPVPSYENIEDSTNYWGPVGQFTVYVVLINPHNENTGELIQTVGGFEFQVVIPADLVATPHLPPGVYNFMEYPDFFCGAELPVVGNQCLLFSMDIEIFTTHPRFIYLLPVSDIGAQSIPGDLAITDAGDEHSLSRATPTTLDYEYPVYSMFNYWFPAPREKDYWDDCWAVPNQTTSWGSIKAMYR